MPTPTFEKPALIAPSWRAGLLAATIVMTLMIQLVGARGAVAGPVAARPAVARPVVGAAGKSSAPVTCRSAVVPVQVPQVYAIATELCVPPNGSNLVVHLVVHGTTYGGSYWDWPYRPGTFSYARTLAGRGYAVLTFDRLGNGGSSHPPSANITYGAHVQTIHQLIGYLRSGAFGVKYSHVILVGHSSGSVYCWGEAAQYADEDGVIITGEPHNFSSQSWPEFVATLYPAHLDPNFASLGLDNGYFTTIPGTRSLFYNTADTDPENLVVEDQLKQTMTFYEEAGANSSDSLQIHVPVLIAIGQQDFSCYGNGGVDCSSAFSYYVAEHPYYGPQACLAAFVLLGSGHAINLHSNAPDFFDKVARWTAYVLNRPNPQQC